MDKLTNDDRRKLRELPFYVYTPSTGGGKDWAHLINAGLVAVDDVGGSQETVLCVSLTKKGRAALAASDGHRGAAKMALKPLSSKED